MKINLTKSYDWPKWVNETIRNPWEKHSRDWMATQNTVATLLSIIAKKYVSNPNLFSQKSLVQQICASPNVHLLMIYLWLKMASSPLSASILLRNWAEQLCWNKGQYTRAGRYVLPLLLKNGGAFPPGDSAPSKPPCFLVKNIF